MELIRHLFWDFDGTLYDSYPQVQRAFISGLEVLGLGGILTDEEMMKRLKISVYSTARWYAEQSGLDAQKIIETYHSFRTVEMDFPPYSGMADCLRRLKDAGYRHYLYTHRDHKAVDQLEKDGLWALFDDAVLRTDGFPDKPAPDALLALMARNHLKPEACAMVGDRGIDIEAGHNAGMSGYLFDPDGFYAGYPAELSAVTMQELCEKILKA